MPSRSSRGRRRKGQWDDGAWDVDMMAVAVEVNAVLVNTRGQLLRENLGFNFWFKQVKRFLTLESAYFGVIHN